MKKLFLTSGVILCMACPAFADEAHYDIKNDNVNLTNNDPATCQYPTLGKYTGPQTFYAKWAPHGYHVRYNNQAVIQGSTTATQVAGTTVVDDVDYNASYTIRNNIDNSVFAKQGYTFTGWLSDHNLSNGNSTPVYDADNNNAYSPTTATTYSVAWLENSQNNPLTFLVSSATDDTVEMFAQWTPNKALIALDSKLYVSGSEPVNATSAGTTQVWTRFDNGVYADNATAVAMDPAITTITAPTLTGYTFGGYNTAQDGTGTQMITVSTVGDVTTVAIAAELKNLSDGHAPNATITTADATLYAQWTANHYTLTYNCGTPTVEGSNSVARFKGALSDQTHAFDREYAASADNLYAVADVCELDGYHANGWTCVVTNTSTSVDQANIQGTWNVANSVTCTANWTRNTIGLSWDVGADSTRSQTTGGTTCSYDGDIDVEGTPTRAGYDFQGWTTNSAAPAGADYVVFTGQASTAGTSNP